MTILWGNEENQESVRWVRAGVLPDTGAGLPSGQEAVAENSLKR